VTAVSHIQHEQYWVDDGAEDVNDKWGTTRYEPNYIKSSSTQATLMLESQQQQLVIDMKAVRRMPAVYCTRWAY